MNIREREDELFQKWKHIYRLNHECFVVDGSPNPAAFLDSPVKTVIVLKEINALDLRTAIDYDLRLELEKAPNNWWRPVANWCAGMSHILSSKTFRWSDLQKPSIKQCLEPFAFMQLNKFPGGGLVNAATLTKSALRDADNIRAQLRIYQPDVIVSCGLGQLLVTILAGIEWRETERGVRYFVLSVHGNQPTYLIDYMHPSARAAKNIVCYGLLDAYREVVQTHGLGAGIK